MRIFSISRIFVILAAAAFIEIIFLLPSFAFHSGGVADCKGCHTMHNSTNGQVINPNPKSSFLIASDPGSTCLTCHRAHASGWDKAGRWNLKTEFLSYNGDYPGVDRPDVPANYSQGRTKAEIRRAFYERPASRYASFQRSLCNKCHPFD